MLNPQQIVEQLTTDEFINLCQYAKPHKFDVITINRHIDGKLTVFVLLDTGLRERVEVFPWPISA